MDLYSSWSAAIQITHLSPGVELDQSIVGSVLSDKVIIVCKNAEKDDIVSLLMLIGWRSHIQIVVTESDLIKRYEKSLCGEYLELIGQDLLRRLCAEIAYEFLSVDDTLQI